MRGFFALLLAVALSRALPASAQAADPPLIVRDVSFEGNSAFSDHTLSLRVRTHANRRLLGIPGLTWWRWVYSVGERETFGRSISRALRASGEPPAFLDSTLVAADIERLQMFFVQEGFREARVTAEIDTVANAPFAEVRFQIDEGRPTYIRQVQFEGLDALPPAEQYALTRGSLLRPDRIDREHPLTFKPRGLRFSETTLLEERRRILTFLRNEGFAAVSRDSIRAVVYQQSDSFDVALQVRAGAPHRFGDVRIVVVGPENGEEERRDTLLVVDPDTNHAGGVVTYRIEDEGRLSPSLLQRSIQIRPGDPYDQSRVSATKRRLEATGVFSFSDIVPRFADSTGSIPTVSHDIELRTRQRHQIRLETFMLQRSGVLTGSDNELGTGLSVSYQNGNLLGGGEAFEVRTTGSIATDTETRLFTSAQAEVAASITYPYLVRPLRRFERYFDLYDARTRLSFSLLTARREELGLVIRGRGAGRFRLEMQHNPTLVSLVDVLDLTVSNPDTLQDFRRKFLDKILGPEDSSLVQDPVQRAQILEDYTQPQVNSAIRYTLRASRVNPLTRDRGYSSEAAFEMGGNLLYLLDRLVFTPDSAEGSLPGLPFFRGESRDSRMIYRRYLRFVGDVRRYIPLSRRYVLAGKFIVGVAHPIARSEVVPFDRRFYSGGATSVRGWGLRQLGPGSAVLANDPGDTGSEVTNIRGGDIKLEASVELRHTAIQNLLAANWIGAAFVDAGNYWFGPRNPGDSDGRFRFDRFYRELGVGSGLGLRVAWEYLIIRFDVAYRVYDPVRRELGLLPDGLREPTFH
ncbi:MAG TPA: BamA/TamA family outer membrane protein, partial [Rhodothermales bacterium]